MNKRTKFWCKMVNTWKPNKELHYSWVSTPKKETSHDVKQWISIFLVKFVKSSKRTTKKWFFLFVVQNIWAAGEMTSQGQYYHRFCMFEKAFINLINLVHLLSQLPIWECLKFNLKIPTSSCFIVLPTDYASLLCRLWIMYFQLNQWMLQI